MKIQEYKNKVIKIILLFIVFGVVFMVFLRYENIGKQEKSEELKIREKAIVELDPSKMSRISFFNASADRVSLAVPEWWEGKYRLKESGDSASFSYIDKAGESQEFFIIKKYPNSSWQDNDPAHENSKESKILKKKNTDFSYYLSPDISADKAQEKEFFQMLDELKLVVQTIK